MKYKIAAKISLDLIEKNLNRGFRLAKTSIREKQILHLHVSNNDIENMENTFV